MIPLNKMSTSRLVVGITGASGALYAVRFLKEATHYYKHIFVAVSDYALEVARTELGLNVTRDNLSSKTLLGEDFPQIRFLDLKDYFTPPASGSFEHDGMVIIPCSMGTLGRIANGVSDDLITRAADVCLKERRKLILVVRETPLSAVMIRNMLRVTEAGGIVLPASPAWYHHPRTLEDLADTVISRVLSNLGVKQVLTPQWQFADE